MENQNPKKHLTDAERVLEWKTRLKERGGYGEAAASLITDFAIKAKSFELDQHGNLRPAGGILVTMFIRLGTRLQEAASVSEDDALAANAQLLQYFQKKPLGDSVEDWRTKYSSNGIQRTAIDTFFGFAGRKFQEFDSGERFLFNVRDAAWPSRKEEEAGTGGTFAERFMIFSKAICRIFMTGQQAPELLFGDFFHEEKEKLPSWIQDDGNGGMMCGECGGNIVTDSRGQYICDNPLCDHNIAAGAFAMPQTFLNQNQGGSAPAPKSGPNPSTGPRDKRDHRHDRDDDDNFPRNKGKRKGPKFRENDEDLPDAEDDHMDTPAMPVGPAAENLGNLGAAVGGALDSIKIN